jgi:hypothetical protein
MSTRFTKKKFSGKKITPTGFVAYRIVDGKIVEGWEESKGEKDKTLPQQQNDVAEKVVAARSNQVGLYKIYEELL